SSLHWDPAAHARTALRRRDRVRPHRKARARCKCPTTPRRPRAHGSSLGATFVLDVVERKEAARMTQPEGIGHERAVAVQMNDDRFVIVALKIHEIRKDVSDVPVLVDTAGGKVFEFGYVGRRALARRGRSDFLEPR